MGECYEGGGGEGGGGSASSLTIIKQSTKQFYPIKVYLIVLDIFL